MQFISVLRFDTSGIWTVTLGALEDVYCWGGFREIGGVGVDVGIGVQVGWGCVVGSDGGCWFWAGLESRGTVVGFVDDEDVVAVELHFRAAVLGDEDFVAFLHGEEGGDVFAFVVLASAKGEHFSFLWLFFGSVWKEDAASGLFFAGGALDEDAASEGCDRGGHSWSGFCF